MGLLFNGVTSKKQSSSYRRKRITGTHSDGGELILKFTNSIAGDSDGLRSSYAFFARPSFMHLVPILGSFLF